MVRPVRALVAAKEQAPIPFFDGGAGLANERNACVRKLLPLLPDLLALVMREHREKIGEVTVPVVAPMKLYAVATDQACGFAFAEFIVADEQYVQRRKPARVNLLQRGIDHRSTRRGVRGQQAGTGYRRKRERGEELRVIAPS